MHILERVSKCVRWCSRHLSNVHTCTCMVLNNTCRNAFHTLHKKCICARACVHIQRCRSFFATKLMRTYLESCASIIQAVLCRPPNCCLDQTCRPTLFAQKSVQIHASSWRGRRCGVAQASFNHPRWCKPCSVYILIALALSHRDHFIKNSILTIFLREFFQGGRQEEIIRDFCNFCFEKTYRERKEKDKDWEKDGDGREDIKVEERGGTERSAGTEKLGWTSYQWRLTACDMTVWSFVTWKKGRPTRKMTLTMWS